MSVTFLPFPAPAKLNLMLKVIGRRADGYHLLETVFRFIDLNDTIEIALRTDDEIHLLNPIEGVPAEQDLTIRAARLLQKATNCQQGADLRITKRIPMGGGLGGGSSDAATVMLALNHLWKTGLNRTQLMQLGVTLGADVPVFLFGQNAFAGGIGEELSALDLPENWYVVIRPPVHIPTAEIFSSPILTRDSPPSIMRTLETADCRRNDLESVVLKEYPLVKEAIDELGKYGPALMTGSGSCVFLECDSEARALHIHQQISGNWLSYVVRGLQQHPLLSL